MKKMIRGKYLHVFLMRLLCPALATLSVAVPVLGADPVPEPSLDCVLEPYEVVEVSSAVQGVINQIHVERNDMVSQGQLLVELDSDVEQTQVELAKARAELQTGIELRETELAFNMRNQERLQQLYQTDTISLHIKDEAETDTRKSRLQLRSARDTKRLAALELAKAEAVLALRSMHSPISGVVVARNRVAGEFVEDQSILRLAQLNPLKVEVIAPVEMFGSITEGMLVEVVPEHSNKGPQFATVTMVDRMIDPASGTFDVRAELPNPDLAIPSGLRCTAQFMDAPLPSEAVAAAPVEEAAGTIKPVEETAAETEPSPEASPEDWPVPETETLAASTDQESADSELEDLAGPESEIATEPELELAAEPAPAEIAATENELTTAVDAAVEAEAVEALEQILARETVSAPSCESPGSGAISGYAVFADPANNSAATRELVDSLRQKGVQELFVVAQGTHRGKVSLGYYSKMDNAEKRQLEISNQGFVVSMVPRIVEPESPACVMAEQLAGAAH